MFRGIGKTFFWRKFFDFSIHILMVRIKFLVIFEMILLGKFSFVCRFGSLLEGKDFSSKEFTEYASFLFFAKLKPFTVKNFRLCIKPWQSLTHKLPKFIFFFSPCIQGFSHLFESLSYNSFQSFSIRFSECLRNH